MTLQEIFDIVGRHLLTQMRKSLLPQLPQLPDQYLIKTCAYRGADGCKCAAGVLIPDHLYAPFLEGRAVSDQIVSAILVEALFGNDPPSIETQQQALALVRSLQSVHDGMEPMHWRQGLADKAQDYGLSMATLNLEFPQS